MSTTTAPIGARAQGGPPLWGPATAYTALMLAGVLLSAAMPRTTDSGQAILAYQSGHLTALRVAAFLQFGSAMPLAIWAATSYRRLRMLGVTAPGSAIGLAGGLLAAAMLALSGLVGWSAAQTADVADPAQAKLLAQAAFATGGVGFTTPFALLLAGIAVPGLILRLLPRPLAWSGLVIGAVGVLSSATILTQALDPTLPITRFGGALWLIAVGILLPRTRRRQPRGATVRTSPDQERSTVTRGPAMAG